MSRFTKNLRQEIIEAFARDNNGWFDPHAFVAHVREVGADHPAHAWFEWDDNAAAEAYRLDQARDFARGLRVEFTVETIERDSVRVVTAPFLTSPVATRKSGGGYYVTDLGDAEHVAEMKRQAAQYLRWFVSRYEAILDAPAVDALTTVQGLLESGGLRKRPDLVGLA